MTRKFTLIASMAALQILDVATTNLALANGAVEANPLAALAMVHLGAWWMVPKLMVGAVTCAAMCRWTRMHIVTGCVAFYALIQANNVLVTVGIL